MSNPNQSNTMAGVFVATLSAMHGGEILADLDEALRRVTEKVHQAQKKGKITLELTITPNGIGVGDTPLFKVTENIKITTPEKPKSGVNFFLGEDFNLSRRNPHQDEMRLESVSGSKTPVPALAASAPRVVNAT